MRKVNHFLLLNFVFAVGLAIAASGSALADTITQWNYNSSTTSPSFGSGIQGTLANPAGGATLTLSSVSAAAGNTDPGSPDNALKIAYSQIYNVNSGVTWAVSTSNYEDISVSIDLYRTSTSTPRYYTVAYSIDGGTNWLSAASQIDLGTSMTGWYPKTFDLSSFSRVENNSNFMFRLFEDGAPTSSMTSAFSTIDYVTFSGTPVPIPAAVWLLGSGLVGLVVIKRRKKI